MIDNVNVKYIPTNDGLQSSKRSDLLTLVLFLYAGCSVSFIIRDAIYCELAWLEISQPEGLKLAAWFELMQSVGSLIFLCIMYIESRKLWPKQVVAYGSSVLSVFVCIMLSFTWSFSVDGMSLFVLLGTIGSTIIGWTLYIMIIPWLLRNYKPELISPFLGGKGLMILILVIAEIIQQPGGSQTFSPTYYFLIASVILAGSAAVCVYIFWNGIARITPDEDVQTLPSQRGMWVQFFPAGWRKANRYLFIRLVMDQWVYTVVPVILPYAADNTTNSATNEGQNYLQWAIVLTFIGQMVGSLSSYFAKEKFWINETAGSIALLSPIIFLAAANVGNWSSWAMRSILMVAIAMTRMLFWWTLPLIFRELNHKFPENGAAFCRANSLWNLVSNMIIKIPTWWLVYNGVISA